MKRKRENENLLELFFSQFAMAKNLGHARTYATETLLWKPV